MSLRDLGIYAPLKDDDSDITMLRDLGDRCWKCDHVLGPGTRTALCPIETPDQSGSLTVRAKLVCATCHLKGVEVKTPAGIRIVERIKDGDASPYPVYTTDGQQWKDDEVTNAH